MLVAEREGHAFDPESALAGRGGVYNEVNLAGYGYAQHNPVRLTDPDGQFVIVLAITAAAVAILTSPTTIGEAYGEVKADLKMLNTIATLTGAGPIIKFAVAATEGVVTSTEGQSLEKRAQEIQSAIPEATQRRTTTAVTDTEEGVRVVSSSERRLRPGQRAMLKPGEIEGIGRGHAEVTGVNAAKEQGLNPTAVGASRPICSECASFLENEGVKPSSAIKP